MIEKYNTKKVAIGNDNYPDSIYEVCKKFFLESIDKKFDEAENYIALVGEKKKIAIEHFYYKF